MAIPTLNITFRQAAKKTAAKLTRGTVAVIVKDTAQALAGTVAEVSTVADIPAALSADNKKYIERALIGGDQKPKRAYVAVMGSDGTYAATLAALEKYNWDWLAADPECGASDAATIATWIAAQRGKGAVYKAVLPNKAANDAAIVNFAASDITAEGSTVTTAAFCSRIAGLIAGTGIAQSITYYVLPDVTDCERLTADEMSAAVAAGKLILMHDGEKVKIVSGVTSLVPSGGKSDPLQKIKTVEVIDAIRRDITLLVQDGYIGKLPNTYDNKCVLITAIRDYLRTLEAEDVLAEGSTVEIDVAAQRDWLKSAGVDVSDMDDDAVKTANTGTHVFLAANISIYDVIETINIEITYTMEA